MSVHLQLSLFRFKNRQWWPFEPIMKALLNNGGNEPLYMNAQKARLATKEALMATL